MQPEVQPKSGFLANVNVVFVSQVLIYGLAFLLRVVLARGLGDSGLGTYSLFFIAVLVAGGLASLGANLGNIYFLNKGEYTYSTLLSGSIFLLLASTVLSLLVVFGYALVYEPHAFVSGGTYWLYAAALPAVVAYLLFTSFLHGSSRFVALTAVAVCQGLIAFLAAAALDATHQLDVFGAAAAWTASFGIAALMALALVHVREIDLRLVVRPPWRVIKEQVRYGVQGQVANLAQLFNYRLDQFLVAAYVSRAGVGHYTVAVGLGESVWWISSAVSMVLLPRLTAMDRDRAEEVTPVIVRNTLFVSVIAAVALMAVSPVAIRILFGSEFTASTVPLLLLMPGIVAGSAARVLGSYLFSQGRIIYNTYATFIALGVTLVLDFGLIPLLHVNGAAIASSVAYTASLIASLYWYRSVSGNSMRDALLFRWSDLPMYQDVLQKVLSRVRPAQGRVV